jgi:hypothetical protein
MVQSLPAKACSIVKLQDVTANRDIVTLAEEAQAGAAVRDVFCRNNETKTCRMAVISFKYHGRSFELTFKKKSDSHILPVPDHLKVSFAIARHHESPLQSVFQLSSLKP